MTVEIAEVVIFDLPGFLLVLLAVATVGFGLGLLWRDYETAEPPEASDPTVMTWADLTAGRPFDYEKDGL